jgi:hypothetical protein
VNTPKVIAFHLPQFHCIPENDRWWGKGFTDWSNVRRARPLYRGHLQPRVPAEDRYYNLLDSEVQDWQASLARRYGIHGFCYYHYWFNGKQLLERPVEMLLERGKPDFPFCLAWANEPWTRTWDGGEKDILIAQEYGGPEQWRQHFSYLLRAFQDPRYIRVYNKPMFLIYRSTGIRELQPMLELWQNEAVKAGLPGLHVVSMATGFGVDPRLHLFNAFADFEPMFTLFHRLPRHLRRREQWLRRWTKLCWRLLRSSSRTPHSFDYSRVWQQIQKRDLQPHYYPGAFADWDNSSRRELERCLVSRNFDRDSFTDGITAQINKARRSGAEFLFFNAWNEWAEGTYLEPDTARGLFFLEAIHNALNKSA